MAEKKFELTNLATGKKASVEVKSGTLGFLRSEERRVGKECV